jgi:hypothetical protein
MRSGSWNCRWLVAVMCAVLCWSSISSAQERKQADGDADTPANSGLQREYARLAQALNSDDVFGKRDAAEQLLRVRPSDVPNAETRKLIARGYKALAEEGRGGNLDNAIRGLVIWGGKYSVPVIIELMEKDRFPSDEYFDALAQLKDPRGAEAIARYLGNFHSHDKAVAALRRMGPAAEDALIAAAPADDPDVSAAAVLLLGDVGGQKSVRVLNKAAAARNPQVKQAARDAITKIRQRQKSGESPEATEAEDPDSPFAAGSGPPVDIRARGRSSMRGPRGFGNDAEEEELADVYEGDWSGVKVLSGGEPEGAGVPVDPEREILDSKWKPGPVRLGKTTSNHERPESLTVAGGNSPVAVVLHADPFSKSLARLESLNLKRRDASKSSNIVGGVSGIKLSPGATRLLAVSKDASHKDTARLDVFAFNNGTVTEQATWWPFATSDDWRGADITWFDWIDEDQLLTLNGEGVLVLWRLDGKNAKAVYQLDGDGWSSPARTPGRGQLALATGGGVEIYRVLDGRLLARLGESGENGQRLGRFGWGGSVAFNKAGNRLAHVSGGHIAVWNTTNGKLEREFYCSGLARGGVAWLDDGHLLVGGTDVVDLERRLIAWRYQLSMGRMSAIASFGGYHWLVLDSGNATGIAPVEMLQPEALKAAEALDANEVLALKPGAKVTLDIQLGGEDQAKAEAALKAAAERNGMEIVSDSPIRISAQVVTGNTETKEYSRGGFLRGGNAEQVTTTEKRYEVEVKIDGESIYKQVQTMQSAGGPMVVTLKDGETAQQVIDRENAERASRFTFSATLPKYVVHPKYAGPLGTSPVPIVGRR